MTTKLQTKLAHKRLTTITVNGHTYDIDAQCCCVVDDPADVKKLLSLGGEWSDKVSAFNASLVARLPEPGKPMRSAAEFIELAAQDSEVGAKIASIRSFPALLSFAMGLGFKFSEQEFKQAGETFAASTQRAAELQAANDAKLAPKAPAKEEKKGKAAKVAEPEAVSAPVATDYSKAELASELPAKLDEEESGAWPDDANEGMGLAYLRRMATFHSVKYAANASKADLVSKINKAMYE